METLDGWLLHVISGPVTCWELSGPWQHDYWTIMALKHGLLKTCSNQPQDAMSCGRSWESWQDRSHGLGIEFKACTSGQAAERRKWWMTAPVSSFPALTRRCTALLLGESEGWCVEKWPWEALSYIFLSFCTLSYHPLPPSCSISPIPSSLAPNFSSLLALKFGICWRFSET